MYLRCASTLGPLPHCLSHFSFTAGVPGSCPCDSTSPAPSLFDLLHLASSYPFIIIVVIIFYENSFLGGWLMAFSCHTWLFLLISRTSLGPHPDISVLGASWNSSLWPRMPCPQSSLRSHSILLTLLSCTANPSSFLNLDILPSTQTVTNLAFLFCFISPESCLGPWAQSGPIHPLCCPCLAPGESSCSVMLGVLSLHPFCWHPFPFPQPPTLVQVLPWLNTCCLSLPSFPPEAPIPLGQIGSLKHGLATPQ